MTKRTDSQSKTKAGDEEVPPSRSKRLPNCHHFGLASCWLGVPHASTGLQGRDSLLHVADDIMHVRKMVPLLPRYLFKGYVSQHPMTAQHRYGAAFTRPTSPALLESWIPNACT